MMRGVSVGQKKLMHEVEEGLRKAQSYEDELAQALAMSVMPLEELQAAAAEAAAVSAALQEEPRLEEEDALAEGLLRWFKSKFFTWVDAPPCSHCGSKHMAPISTAGPTPDEAEGLASHTELYCCTLCHAVTRFPRYNDACTLLNTRCGRCGEWANCFGLCCR